MIKLYLARKMTSVPGRKLVRDSARDMAAFFRHGFAVCDPVTTEGVVATNKPLVNTEEDMDRYWDRDKAMIRSAHCFVNMTPHIASLGVTREYGYARYFLQKPCISVFPQGILPKPGAICYYEDDLVTDNIEWAAVWMKANFGTLEKRLKWRMRKQIPTLPKRIAYQLGEWK